MRRPGEIRQKYKQLKFRLQKKKIEEQSRRIPENCTFHMRLESANGKSVGLCQHRGDSEVPVWCDPKTPEGIEQAQTCVHFCPLFSADAVKEFFGAMLQRARKTGDLGEVAYHYPDLAALIWVLGTEIEEEAKDAPGENLDGSISHTFESSSAQSSTWMLQNLQVGIGS